MRNTSCWMEFTFTRVFENHLWNVVLCAEEHLKNPQLDTLCLFKCTTFIALSFLPVEKNQIHLLNSRWGLETNTADIRVCYDADTCALQMGLKSHTLSYILGIAIQILGYLETWKVALENWKISLLSVSCRHGNLPDEICMGLRV